jgi:hypothetical protein
MLSTAFGYYPLNPLTQGVAKLDDLASFALTESTLAA